MHFQSLGTAVILVGAAVAQRPTDVSICDYYTTALYKNNTAPNQLKLLTQLVNTALTGNRNSRSTTNVTVTGILTPGVYNGITVNLLPYFNGGLVSTNGGNKAVSVNFLDSNGACFVDSYKDSCKSTNQYFLMTHLFQYFGSLLGCSQQGGADFPAYTGSSSQYEVHKFMVLSDAEVNYFIEQAALSAEFYGVAASDLMIFGYKLRQSFGYRCLPPTTIILAQGSQLQSICTDMSCPLAPGSQCPTSDQTIAKPVMAACYKTYSSCIQDLTTLGSICDSNLCVCRAEAGYADRQCMPIGSVPGSGSGSSISSSNKTGSAIGTGSGTSSNAGSGVKVNGTTPSSGSGTTINVTASSSGPGNQANSTVATIKPSVQATADAALVSLSFGVMVWGLAVFLL